jgi:hypothetical protein
VVGYRVRGAQLLIHLVPIRCQHCVKRRGLSLRLLMERGIGSHEQRQRRDDILDFCIIQLHIPPPC